MTNRNDNSKPQPTKTHPQLSEFVARIIAATQDYSTENLAKELGYTSRRGLQSKISRHRKGGDK